jgi:polyphosphate kinase 2 (PPK2 family)
MAHKVPLKQLPAALRVEPGTRFDLRAVDGGRTFGRGKAGSAKALAKRKGRLIGLRARLRTERRGTVLLVLLGTEAACTDRVIHDVLDAVDAESCPVTWFRVPTARDPRAVDLRHGSEWRFHASTPSDGAFAILDPSPYDDVRAARAAGRIDEATSVQRCHSINEFEQEVVAAGTTVVKLFLHVDPGGQADRSDDIEASSECIAATSTEIAPWYVIPGNHRWFRTLAVMEVVAQALENAGSAHLPGEPGQAGVAADRRA